MSRFDNPSQGTYDIFDDPDAFSSGLFADADDVVQAQDLTEPTAGLAADPVIDNVTPATPAEGSVGVLITVSNDRGSQGTLLYDGSFALTVTGYTPGNPATYVVDWPVVSSPGSTTPFNAPRDLVFTTASTTFSSAPLGVSTAPDPNRYLGVAQLNDLGVEGMWDNDTDVEFGVDQYYGAFNPPVGGGAPPGDWDLTNLDKGVLNAVPDNGAFSYQYYDVSAGLWTGAAIETFDVLTAAIPGTPTNLFTVQDLTEPVAVRNTSATPIDVEQAQNIPPPSGNIGGSAAAENIPHGQELTEPVAQKSTAAVADNVVQLHTLSEPIARRSVDAEPDDVEQAQFVAAVQAQGEDPVPLNMAQLQVLGAPFAQRRGLSSIEEAFTQQYDDLDGRYFPPHRKRRRR